MIGKGFILLSVLVIRLKYVESPKPHQCEYIECKGEVSLLLLVIVFEIFESNLLTV